MCHNPRTCVGPVGRVRHCLRLWEPGVPPSSRPAFRPRPHVALQPRQPRQYRHLRAAQPVNVAFCWLFPVERHVHTARTASAATSRANSRDGRDGRDGRVSRGYSAAVSRPPAHGRRPGLARERCSGQNPSPPGARTPHAYRGLDSQPAPGAEVGVIVGTLRSQGAGVPHATPAHARLGVVFAAFAGDGC